MKCFDPTVTRKVKIGEKTYVTNDKYYLIDYLDWDEQFRDWCASKENIKLTAEHHQILQFIRESFACRKVQPVVRTVTAELKQQFGAEKGSVQYFHVLFPLGIHQAYLLAGLPMLDSCC